MDIDIKFALQKLAAHGLTQSAIAAAIKCKQPTVSAMMAGKIGKTRPSYKIVQGIQVLAKKHGVDIRPVQSEPTLPYVIPNGAKRREAAAPVGRQPVDPKKEMT